MNVCDKIRKQREDCNLTQVDMAKIMGMARQTYIDLESGKTQPRIDKLELMCSLFSVSFDYWSSKASPETGDIHAYTDLQLINELQRRAELKSESKKSERLGKR